MMTLHEVLQTVNRCYIRNPPFPITMTAAITQWNNERVVVATFRAAVRERDAGTPDHLQCQRVFFPTTEPGLILHECEGVVRDMFEHEFRECWHVDGQRIYDPHNPSPMTRDPVIR